MPTCTLPTAVKIFATPCCEIQSKPLKVRAKAKMFLKMMRQVKDSIARSPLECEKGQSVYIDGIFKRLVGARVVMG